MTMQEVTAFPEFPAAKETDYLQLRNRIVALWNDSEDKSKPLSIDKVIMSPSGAPDKKSDELRKVFQFLVNNRYINHRDDGEDDEQPPKAKIPGFNTMGAFIGPSKCVLSA
jgi:hypothetical protein